MERSAATEPVGARLAREGVLKAGKSFAGKPRSYRVGSVWRVGAVWRVAAG